MKLIKKEKNYEKIQHYMGVNKKVAGH